MDVALYYPYVHFRDPAWLKHAVLYWDCIERIGPTRHLYPPKHWPGQEDDQKLLESHGVIRSVLPDTRNLAARWLPFVGRPRAGASRTVRDRPGSAHNSDLPAQRSRPSRACVHLGREGGQTTPSVPSIRGARAKALLRVRDASPTSRSVHDQPRARDSRRSRRSCVDRPIVPRHAVCRGHTRSVPRCAIGAADGRGPARRERRYIGIDVAGCPGSDTCGPCADVVRRGSRSARAVRHGPAAIQGPPRESIGGPPRSPREGLCGHADRRGRT